MQVILQAVLRVTMKSLILKKIIPAIAVVMMAMCLFSCSGDITDDTSGDSDQMWSESRSGEVIEVYMEDGRVYTADGQYELSELAAYDEIEEGGRYKVTADITYLNGGVAGYVDFPQIDRVISIERIEGPEETGRI